MRHFLWKKNQREIRNVRLCYASHVPISKQPVMPSYSSRRRRLVFILAVRGNFSIPWSRPLISKVARIESETLHRTRLQRAVIRTRSRRIPVRVEDTGFVKTVLRGGYHVSTELLREHVSEMRSDCLPGRQGGSLEGLHVFPCWLLQMRNLRYQAHPEDLLQQSAHDQWQRSVLQQSRAQTRTWDSRWI